MRKGKVSIADGPVETRDNLHGFRVEYNKVHPDDRVRTLGAAIDKLIEEYNRLTQELEQKTTWYKYQKERVKELEGILEACTQMCEEKDKRIKALEEEIKKLKGDLKCQQST